MRNSTLGWRNVGTAVQHLKASSWHTSIELEGGCLTGRNTGLSKMSLPKLISSTSGKGHAGSASSAMGLTTTSRGGKPAIHRNVPRWRIWAIG